MCRVVKKRQSTSAVAWKKVEQTSANTQTTQAPCQHRCGGRARRKQRCGTRKSQKVQNSDTARGDVPRGENRPPLGGTCSTGDVAASSARAGSASFGGVGIALLRAPADFRTGCQAPWQDGANKGKWRTFGCLPEYRKKQKCNRKTKRPGKYPELFICSFKLRRVRRRR